MTSKRVNVSVPADLFDRMEAVRGDVSRSRWVVRALESALAAGYMSPDDAERVLKRQNPMPVEPPPGFGVPENERERGCPECGGDLRPVPDTTYRMCTECQALSS